MKLDEIAKKPEGTYVGTVFDKETKKAVKDFMIELDVPNRTPSDRLHSTIIYSRKYVPELKASDAIYPLKAKGKELHIFKTRDEKNALVIKIDCPELIARHNKIMDEYQTTYDFPEYIPHVTVSYDCGDFDIKSFKGKLPDFTITGEYVEDLQLTWNDKD